MAIEKRTGNETPRPLLGKTAKYQRVVRFVDLNDSLNKVEETFVQLPENPSNGDALVYNSTTGLWEAGVASDPTLQTAVVEISSAQILAMGTSPIELLPAAGVGKYYEWYINLEYTHNTINYNITNYIHIFGLNADYAFIDPSFIKSGEDRIVSLRPNNSTWNDSAGGKNYFFSEATNTPLEISIDGGVNPTAGNGTLRAIISYRVRTFGA